MQTLTAPVADGEYVERYENENYDFAFSELTFVPWLIYRTMLGEQVLDLGCGPVGNVLGMFCRRLQKYVGVDVLSENIERLESRRREKVLTKNQLRAIEFQVEEIGVERARAEEFAKSFYDKVEELRVCSVVDMQSDFQRRFDSVMQIGCFGCLDEESQLLTALKNAASYLAPGGKFLTVYWLRTGPAAGVPEPFAGKLGYTMTAEKHTALLNEAGFTILEKAEVFALTPRALAKGCTSIYWALCTLSAQSVNESVN